MPIKLDSGFEISMFSDSDFEKMTALVHFQDNEVLQVIIDDGFDKAMVKFFNFGDEMINQKSYYLNDIIESMNKCMECLSEYK